MKVIDLNCDIGEGFENDESIMPYISSANIACGFHAGDDYMMKRTMELCLQNNVAIGAHPGYADKENFGRNEQNLSFDEIYKLTTEQLYIFKKNIDSFTAKIHHVKPHGALYNQAAKDTFIAAAIAKAVFDIDSSLVMYGLSGSHLIKEAQKLGLRTASEVFADRTYQNNGSLTDRKQRNALITDAKVSLDQVIKLVYEQKVTSVNNVSVPIKAETICLHGDGDHAVEFATNIYNCLKENNIEIKAV
jgi:UPF0271 protein